MATDPFLQLAGAVQLANFAVPGHYGSPLQEQRALAAGDAVTSLSHNEIVTVSGADRLTWLHSMTTQHLSSLAPGESTETLLLNPQGRIEHAIRLVDDGERAWLLVDAGEAKPLIEYLLRMRFALRVEVADVSESYAVVAAFGGGKAQQAIRELGVAVAEWHDPWANTMAGGAQYATGEHAGADWSAVQFVVPRSAVSQVTALVRAGVIRAAGVDALEALEVRAWRPSWHGEVDEKSIPHELDWLRTSLHLNKGCYRGQETVAKAHNLGHPPRRLVLLHLDGSGGQLPPAGAEIFLVDGGERVVGNVTRAVQHHEWGGIALALIKRTTAVDAELAVVLDQATGERVVASQEVIVPPDAGATRNIARLPRLPRL